MDALTRLTRARIKLSLHMPFFGNLLLNCQLREEPQIPTMATDGRDIFYNVEFVENMEMKGRDDEYLQGILCHEVMHKVFLHVDRLKGRNKERFNVAADYIINDFISKAGVPLPQGVLLSDEYDMNWSADACYEDLVQKFDPDAQDNPDHLLEGNDFKPSDGKPSQGQATSPSEMRQRELEMQQQLTAARDAQKRAGGHCPDVIAKLVDDLIQPKVDWRAKLRDFVQMTGKSDVSWARPSRRGLPHGLYLPIMRSEECPHLCIIFDTSGSIYCNQETVTAFLSEVNGIIEDCPPEKITIIHTDTAVRHEEVLEKGEMVDNNFHGGGGTDFQAVMEHVTQLEEAPAAVIFFTDLYVSDHGQDPNCPVHWMVYDNKTPEQPPFGEVTVIEL